MFRYQLICPALDPGLSTKARGRSCGHRRWQHAGPFAGKRRYSRDTLDRWIRPYRAGGFDALVPSTRQPGPGPTRRAGARGSVEAGEPGPHRRAGRPDPAGLDRLLSLGVDAAAAVPPPGLTGPAAGEAEVFGRFEAAAPNERWVGDALHGPRVGGPQDLPVRVPRRPFTPRRGLPVRVRRGRRAPGAALSRRSPPAGPRQAYVDNGSAYVDSWLLRACAKFGIRLVHATPHRPQGRGKIERFLRTVREQFLVEVADTTAEELAARDHPRRGAAGAERAVHRVGRDGLPPPRALRDRADPAGPLDRRLAGRRAPPGDARRRRADRGVPLVDSGAP